MRPGVVVRTMTPMRFANAHDVPVLVVGAGPAGLAAAIELTRHDIPTLLIERRTVLSSHPRATALSLRSMELVRAWGLEAEVRARGVDVDWRLLESETLADAAAGSALPVGYPGAEQSRMISPTAPACVAQDDLEPLLLGYLRAAAAPHGRVELGTELTGILARRDGVRAHVRDVRTGARRTVHARYVVAADGARSAVRGALGISMLGPEGVLEGFTTLFRAPLWDVVGERRHIIYSVTPTRLPGSPFCPPALRTAGCSACQATASTRRTSAGRWSSSGRVRACRTCRCGSRGPGASRRRRSSRSAGAAAASSWPATPRTASRRGAGRA